MSRPEDGAVNISAQGRPILGPKSRSGGPEVESTQKRFAAAVQAHGALATGSSLLVALSGGLDSTVLLHLLLFSPGLPDRKVEAAHFDHGMRPGSRYDQAWVSGLCRAWGVPLHRGTAVSVPRSEDEAREARLGFLLEVKTKEGMDWILTGHHGDDQAETVLFRIVRGTGLRGLAGIPSTRDPGFYRPLLPFSKRDLVGYARGARLGFRTDPTNESPRFARNFIRHRILPRLESEVAPGARGALRRLARLARENEEAWESLMPSLLDGVLEEDAGQIRVVRSRLLAYGPAVQTRVMREVLNRAGIVLDEVGTQSVMEFTRTGASGGRLHLPGGSRLVREFDGFRIGPMPVRPRDKVLTFRDSSPGVGRVRLGGVEYEVCWGPEYEASWGSEYEASWGPGYEACRGPGYEACRGPEKAEGWSWQVAVPVSGAGFPLSLRGWKPGDRIRLPYGTKKLKKLFAEAKIPSEARDRVPVLADGRGRILWVAGLVTSTLLQEAGDAGTLFFGIRNVDEN